MSARANLLSRLRKKLARPPRELALFFVTSVGARVLGIVCQLLQVALVVKVLGAEAFGFWMSLNGLVALVAFADLGLGMGAQNRLAEIFAHDSPRSREDARAVFGGAFYVLAGIAVLLALALWAVVAFADLPAIFGLRDPAVAAAAPGAALVIGLLFCAGFPVALSQRLAFARQRGWTYNCAQALGSLLALASVALAVRAGQGLVVITLAGQGALLLANTVLLALQLRELGWLALWRLPLRLAPMRELLGVGAFFGVQQILTTVLFTLPTLVLSTTLGAAAVTPYNLIQRVFNLFAVVQNAFMLPLWPAYSKAKARGEFAGMRRTLRNSVRATLGLTLLPMVVAAPFVPALVEVWVGGEAVGVTPALVALLCVWNALVYLLQPFSFLLAGVSELRRITFYSALSAAAGAALMMLLVRPYGAPGVALGLILGFLPFNFIGCVLETRRYLDAALSAPARPFPSSPPALAASSR